MKALGDPKRVVGAYVTDVEESEEAAAGGRRRQGAGVGDGRLARRAGVGGAARQSDRERDGPGRHVPRHRRPLGIARDRDRRRQPDRHRRRARPRVPQRRALDVRSAAARAGGDRGLRRRRSGIFNAEGVCCYGTNTDIEELKAQADLRRRRSGVLNREPRSRRRDVQARRRHPQDGRLPVRLPSPAAHVPREVAHQGRRDLSPEARLAVLGRR